MKSYRESHLGEGKGAWYDAIHGRKVDSLIWDYFVKPRLTEVFAAAAASGSRSYLDFACGTGRILKVGSAYFETAVGIDVSPDMLVVARERVPAATFHCVDVTRSVDAVSGVFDCVSLFRFLLNAEPSLRLSVLEWIAAHTKPGAFLVGNHHMETFSLSGMVTAASRKLAGRNRNHLSRKQVTDMLAQCGFRIESWHGYRVLPSVMGRSLFGRSLQLAMERGALSIGLGSIGSEQVFVARRA